MCPNNSGISTCGDARVKNKPISGYIEAFIREKIEKGTNVEEVEIIDTTVGQGALWDGEILTLTKLLTPVYNKNIETGEYSPFPIPEFAWNFYTLQDAIDFAKYGIKTTIDTMRFQTVPETAGGPIDILVIKPGSAEWLLKKELKG